MTTRRFAALCITAGMAISAMPAAAQPFPNRPITMIMPFGVSSFSVQ